MFFPYLHFHPSKTSPLISSTVTQQIDFLLILFQSLILLQITIIISMSHNWPSFPFQTTPPPAAASWVDDFLDFSSARRSMHRRTASDPIAFVEEGDPHRSHGGFEKLDDEQLRSMFSDEVAAAMGPSTSSDRNSEDDEKKVGWLKSEPGEVEISSQAAADIPAPGNYKYSDNGCSHTIVDPKRIKRILANRQSAQRSRVRKLQYISELERNVTNLQNEVSALSPRVAFFDHQRLILNVDNSALKQRIAALAQDKIFKDAHEEALRKEIERLRRVYHDQNIEKMDNSAAGDSPPPSTGDKRGCTADDE